MEDAEAAYGMSKSATKISGVCGRLMCCIRYEEGEASPGSKSGSQLPKKILNKTSGEKK
jgi:hypothetical protein